MRQVKLFWDPDRELFMDVNGFVIEDVCKWLPYWARELAILKRDEGTLYFSFQLDSSTFVEIFWPSEDVNWYL